LPLPRENNILRRHLVLRTTIIQSSRLRFLYFYIPNIDTRREVISENIFITLLSFQNVNRFLASSVHHSINVSSTVAATPTDPSVLSETLSDLVIGFGITAESSNTVILTL